MNRRDRERRKAANDRISEKWGEWSIVYSLAHSRPRGLAKAQLFELLKSLLPPIGSNNIVNRGMLIDAHRMVNKVAFKVAAAEVDIFKAVFAEELRRDGMPLVHPLTDEGQMYAETVDMLDSVQIARCVPGLGGAGPVTAWRVASRKPDDPVFEAYLNQRDLSGRRAIERAHRLATAGLAAGVVSSVRPLPPTSTKLIEP